MLNFDYTIIGTSTDYTFPNYDAFLPISHVQASGDLVVAAQHGRQRKLTVIDMLQPRRIDGIWVCWLRHLLNGQKPPKVIVAG